MDDLTAPGDRSCPRQDTIDLLCNRSGGVAIVDPGDPFLLGGDRDALAGLAEAARAAGAVRVVRGRA